MRGRVLDFRKETVWRGPTYNREGYDKSFRDALL